MELMGGVQISYGQIVKLSPTHPTETRASSSLNTLAENITLFRSKNVLVSIFISGIQAGWERDKKSVTIDLAGKGTVSQIRNNTALRG